MGYKIKFKSKNKIGEWRTRYLGNEKGKPYKTRQGAEKRASEKAKTLRLAYHCRIPVEVVYVRE